jgi:hypothetical protein
VNVAEMVSAACNSRTVSNVRNGSQRWLPEAGHHRCHGEDPKADAFILKTAMKPSVWNENRESGHIVRARLLVALVAVCAHTWVRCTLVPNRDAVRTIRGKAVRLKHQGSIS